MNNFKIYNDNCLNVLKTMEDNSIDSCVTDPPYGIAFMGKDWDNFSTSKNSALGKKSPANEKSKQFPTRGQPIGGWSDADRQAAYNFEKWCEEWATEVYRVLKPGGVMTVIVPNARFAIAHQDPMDVRKFTKETFSYFLKGSRQYDLYGSVYGFKEWSSIRIEENARHILTVTMTK